MLRINLPGVVTDSMDISQFVIGQMDDLVNHSIRQGSQNKCSDAVMTGFSTTPAQIGQINDVGTSSGLTKDV